MAKVFDNILISGLRGRVGSQLVFRVVNGVTVVSHAPKKAERKTESAAQRQTRITFRMASHWAKAQLNNPEQRRYYRQLAKAWNLTNAYTAAIKDYMRNANRLESSGRVGRTSQYPRHRATTELQQIRVGVDSSLLRAIAPVTRKACRITDIQPLKCLVSDSSQASFERYLNLFGRRDAEHGKLKLNSFVHATRDRPSLPLSEYQKRIGGRAAVEQT